jgi:L-ascorbate oxidase
MFFKLQKITNIAADFNTSLPLTAEYLQELDRKGLLKRNFDRPILKDTYTMQKDGYAIVRFIADNPGFWMVHCHLDSHADSGMMAVLKVGESKDLPPKPPNWPSCGSYDGSVKSSPSSNNILLTFFNHVYDFFNSLKY